MTKNVLERLSELLAIIVDEKLTAALQELYEYLERNQRYITDYQKWKNENLPFTSTIAESSVNELINTRQKNNKKMQWTRAGAHNVLQIRASRFSKSWEQDWEKAQEQLYLKAA